MNIKSLHAVIPNNNGLQALIYHLHQHLLQQPLKDTLVGLAENAYYHQVAGVAMGTKLGPIYASPFVGYVERRMFEDYQGNKPELNKRYIGDIRRASSGTLQDLEEFTQFCSTYHPSKQYSFEI